MEDKKKVNHFSKEALDFGKRFGDAMLKNLNSIKHPVVKLGPKPEGKPEEKE